MDRTASRCRTALVAVAAVIAISGGVGPASAAGPSQNQVGNLITPCRLVDTRPPPSNVGPRSTPIGPAETFTTKVTGSNGNCVLPAGATGIIANVTAVGPTAQSNLTVFPAGQDRPRASNLNWIAGQAPVPNQVTTPLSATGSVSFYNNSGTVNIIVDVVGYFTGQDLSNYYTKSETNAAIAAATADPCTSSPAEGVDWTGCDQAGRDLSGGLLFEARLTGANFAGANLSGADLASAVLTGANFSGANLSGAFLDGGPNFATQLAARGANFAGADLSGTSMRNANLIGADLTGANLTGAVLRFSNLTQSNLTGVVWSNTVCPDDSLSSSNGTNPQSCIGHL